MLENSSTVVYKSIIPFLLLSIFSVSAFAQSNKKLIDYKVAPLKFQNLKLVNKRNAKPFVYQKSTKLNGSQISFYSISKYADYPDVERGIVKKSKSAYRNYINGIYSNKAKAIEYNNEFIVIDSVNALPSSMRLLRSNCEITGCSKVEIENFIYLFTQWEYVDDNDRMDEMLIILVVYEKGSMKFHSYYVYKSPKNYTEFSGFYNEGRVIDIPYLVRPKLINGQDCMLYNLYSIDVVDKHFEGTRFKNHKEAIIICE